jgi:uncharacterized protein with HEPN domain
MEDEIKKHLFDILTGISSIDEHLQGKRDYNLYVTNSTVRRAVERELEIIGEAMSRVLNQKPDIEISYARIIVDLRNKVIHAYDAVNSDSIWKIIIKDIPVLKVEIEALLKK